MTPPGHLTERVTSGASWPERFVCSDLQFGGDSAPRFPTNSLVFLHRFGPQSFLYTLGGPDRFSVFVDPGHFCVDTRSHGAGWVVLARMKSTCGSYRAGDLTRCGRASGGRRLGRGCLSLPISGVLAFLCSTMMGMSFGSRREPETHRGSG